MGLNFSEDLFFFFFFGVHIILGKNWISFESRFFFFWFSPNFGQKMGLNLSEDLFFGFHLILGKKWVLISLKTFFLAFGGRHRPSYPLEKFLSEALFGCLPAKATWRINSVNNYNSSLFLSTFFWLLYLETNCLPSPKTGQTKKIIFFTCYRNFLPFSGAPIHGFFSHIAFLWCSMYLFGLLLGTPWSWKKIFGTF